MILGQTFDLHEKKRHRYIQRGIFTAHITDNDDHLAWTLNLVGASPFVSSTGGTLADVAKSINREASRVLEESKLP